MTRWGFFLLVVFFVLGLGKTSTNKAIALTVCVTALVADADDGHLRAMTSPPPRRSRERTGSLPTWVVAALLSGAAVLLGLVAGALGTTGGSQRASSP